MTWVVEHWVAVTLLTSYALVLLYHAQVGRQVTQNQADYFIGGRNMGGVAIGISYYATFASTNSYIGNAGKGYEYGAPWMIMTVFMMVFAYLSWTQVAPKLRRFTSHWDALTLPDYLEARFGGRAVRRVAAVIVVFASLLYVLAIFKGAGNLFQYFLGVPYTVAVWVTFVIVMLYTSVGGFVSVVRTDVLQGVLMLVGSVTMFFFITDAAGGVTVIAAMWDRPDTKHLFTWSAGVPLVVLLGIAFSGSLKLLVDPRQVSRFYALKDESAVRVGVWVAVGGIAIVQLSLFPLGLYAHELLTGVTDTDLIIPTLVNDAAVFPTWVGDFLIVAIVAAAMSSLDSVLLVAATVLSKDVFQSQKKASAGIGWTRGWVVVVAFVGAVLALNPPAGIIEITIFSGSLYAACFFPVIVFGLHWRRGDAVSALVSMVTGAVVLLGWLALGWRDYLHEVFPALLASCTVYTVVAFRRAPFIQRWPDAPTPENLV